MAINTWLPTQAAVPDEKRKTRKRNDWVLVSHVELKRDIYRRLAIFGILVRIVG